MILLRTILTNVGVLEKAANASFAFKLLVICTTTTNKNKTVKQNK